MARNEEKQLGRLNRLYLKQKKDEEQKKNPKRPRLDAMNTAEDIKQWLPSIKKDIDFCLKQSQVPCYPDSKIKEFNKKIDHLQGEYKAFVRKLRRLDPKMGETPWIERGYQKGQEKSKKDLPVDLKNEPARQTDNGDHVTAFSCDQIHTHLSNLREHGDTPELLDERIDTHLSEQKNTSLTLDEKTNMLSSFEPIMTPILEKDFQYKTMYGYSQNCVGENIVNSELNDIPLSFVKKTDNQCKNDSYQCKKSIRIPSTKLSKGDNSLLNLLPYSDSSDDSDN